MSSIGKLAIPVSSRDFAPLKYLEKYRDTEGVQDFFTIRDSFSPYIILGRPFYDPFYDNYCVEVYVIPERVTSWLYSDEILEDLDVQTG